MAFGGANKRMIIVPFILGLTVLLILCNIFAGQLAHPEGWFGRRWIVPLLNKGNRAMMDAALKALDAKPGERIADIGFGGGYAIDQLLPLVRPETVVGVEVSETMVDLGVERWGDDVELYLAGVTAMPLTTASLDGALSVNTIYFWSDPVAALREIHRTLKPGGRLVLGVRNAAAMRLSPVTWFKFRLYSEDRLRALLREAGFEVRFESAGPAAQIAIARPV